MYIVLLCAIFVICVCVYIRNAIVKSENAVKRSWADVASFERQKVKILDELIPMIESYNAFEQSTLTQITALRQNILDLSHDKENTGKLEDIEQQTSQLMKMINIQIEAYPELKSSDIYQNVMQQIDEQNSTVTASINIFNRNVEHFNNMIQVFPNNLINSIALSRKPIRPFKDRAQSNFDYQPNFHVS